MVSCAKTIKLPLQLHTNPSLYYLSDILTIGGWISPMCASLTTVLMCAKSPHSRQRLWWHFSMSKVHNKSLWYNPSKVSWNKAMDGWCSTDLKIHGYDIKDISTSIAMNWQSCHRIMTMTKTKNHWHATLFLELHHSNLFWWAQYLIKTKAFSRSMAL